jgi:uncharacterized protein YegL
MQNNSELQNIPEIVTADQRCACMLVVDTSGSMEGEAMEALNEGLEAFEKQLKGNRLSARRIEVGMITFGGEVQLQQDFIQAKHFTAPKLNAEGATPMGEAVDMALQAVRNRKNEFRQLGIQYFRPWLMLITDGEPTDANWQAAAAAVKREEAQKALTCFPIGVGPSVNFDKLAEFSYRRPVSLNGVDFQELFLWLSSSLGKVSASGPGNQIELPPVDSWGSLAV